MLGDIGLGCFVFMWFLVGREVEIGRKILVQFGDYGYRDFQEQVVCLSIYCGEGGFVDIEFVFEVRILVDKLWLFELE